MSKSLRITDHTFASPLRYPGGKGVLAGFMRRVVTMNHLEDGHYAELYAGGAGIAWSLLFSEHVSHVHVNDIDGSLHAFWRCVLEDTENLCRRIRDVKISVPQWRRQRAILRRGEEHHSVAELGFATFFLNRTNRSGIIRGGVIGGLQQTGKWKLDARFHRQDLINRIQRIARYRRRISLYRLDAADFLRTIAPTLPSKTLLYLDPPYFVKGQDLYEHHYQPEDHARIARALKAMKGRYWVVSYDSAPEILELYGRYRYQRYNLAYSAQDRYFGSETIVYGPHLKTPKVANPAGLARRYSQMAQSA